MSNQAWNRVLIASISVLTLMVITLTILIIREGKPVSYDEYYSMQEEATEADKPQQLQQEETTVIEEEKADKVIMVTTRVNIRSTDSEDGRVLDTVEEGATFEFVEVLGSGWTHIIYEDQDAYINSKYVKLVDRDKVAEAKEEKEEKME